MARVNTKVAPYYDTTLEEAAKNYFKLLAVPGRVAQAREITVLQGLLQQAIKSIGDSIMSNGDIVEGCQIIVASDKRSVTVTEGRIYMEGFVNTVASTVIPISGSGTEVIGVKINEYIVSDVDDTTLKDPAQGYDNYGQTGCDRLKRELVIVVNDSEASPIATLVDGDVTVENFSPNYDVITQTLARRTYDESGSYIVEGLKVRVEDGRDSNSYMVVVEAGKAYVLGYELKIPTARRISVPRSTTTTSISASNYVFETGFLSYMLDADPYVESIISVRGRISTTEQQTLQTNTDSIVLNNTDVTSITSVVQGGTTYTVGTGPTSGDCYLLRDGSRYYVKWNGGTAPTSGSSYTVTYQYNTDFVNGTDYELRVDSTGSYLDFLSGNTPLTGTNFTVTYNQYLARKDLVYMDQYGEISVERGAPDEDGYEVAPLAPVNTLPIAQITSPPNGTPTSSVASLRISVENIGLTRFTMNDIQNIVNRVKRTEYNQAVLSLNDDARNRTTINSKKGILTDPLVDFSRIDLYYNLDTDGSKLDGSKTVYDMALDLDAGIAYNPLNVYNYPITGTSNSVKNYGRLITLSTNGERTVLSQSNATKSFQINPYSVFPQLPEVIVNPAVDSWVDDVYVQVPVSLTNSTIVNTTTSILYNTVRRDTTSWWQAYRTPQSSSSSTTTNDRAVGTTSETTVTESVISEEAVAYMRQRELTVEGSNFPPNLDNIKCTFDGTLVTLTPASGTSLGTLSGTVKANDEGYVKATFMVPAGIRTGVREVSLFSDTKVDGYQTTGYTLYQSSGTLRTIQQTLTTVTTVLLQREVTTTVTTTQFNYIDPVGQTFVLDRLSVIKGINVYFESKPTTNDTVILEIRNVVNGSIGSTIYAHTSLKASQVSVSNNGSAPTRFNFSDPVVLDKDIEYAFVVRSFSDKYRIWVSEIGGTDISSGEVVLKNSYLTGVMMSSSNNSIWTAHQTTDVKFDIIEDIYNTSGSITFNPVLVDNVTRLDLVADSVVLNGTTLKWYYSINGGATFYSITPGTLRELGEEATEVILKADFARTSTENITPILAYDTLLLIGSSYKTEGSYVGVNVVGMEPYSNVSVIMNTLVPASTSINVYCSNDNGTTLTQCIKDDSQTVQLNNGWQEVTYTADVSASTSCKIFIKTTGTPSTTPKFTSLRIIMD